VAVGFAGGPGHADFAGTVAGGVGRGVQCCHFGGFGAGGGPGEFGMEEQVK